MFSYFTNGPIAKDNSHSACFQEAKKSAVQRNPRRGHLAVAGRYSTTRTLESEVIVEPTILGKGISTDVHSARHHKSSRLFAVKTLSKEDLSDGALAELRSEIECYLTLDHPHIATLEQVYETENDVHFLMENCEGQELFERLSQRGMYTETEAAHAMRQICVAVSYMHSRAMVHRDLKLENFLYEKKDGKHIKLIDFGFARRWDGKANMSWVCGTVNYMAPEVMARSYTEKVDMWSLGVVLYMLLCGFAPWHPSTEKKLEMIRTAKPYYSPTRFDPLSSDVKKLIKSLMAKDPSMRPSATDVLRSPWLSSFNAPKLSLDSTVLQSFREFKQVSPVRRTCLAMAVWSLPSGEHERLRDHFVALCSENCGAITLTEFVRALASSGIEGSEAEDMFQNLDQDGDGEIAYTEFLAGAMASENLEVDTLHLTFNRFDADGNGEIGAGDLRKVLGKKFKGHGVSELITEADQSGESTVSFEDFCSFLRFEGSEAGGLTRSMSSVSLTSTQSYSEEACKNKADFNFIVAQPWVGSSCNGKF